MDSTENFNSKTWQQLFIFGGIITASFLVTIFGTQLLTLLIWGSEIYNLATTFNQLEDLRVMAAVKFMQAISQLGIFVLPSLLFIYLFRGEYYKNLGVFNVNIWPGVLAAIAIMFLALPFIGNLFEWNQAMKLPAGLAGIESWMLEAEEKANELTKAFLKSTTISALIINLVVMAVIPAIAEELFFRGVLQQLFAKITNRKILAVVITALIFSIIHMQFYGFLPRFLLGLIMGLLYLWSGSIWTAIIAHFVNNAGAVIAGYLYESGISNISYEEVGHFQGWLPLLASIMSVLLIMLYFHKNYKKRIKEIETS
jgi:uncharacterized protein